MKDKLKRKKTARTIRAFRKIHRITAAALFVLFFFISITGVLLGWKKNSNGILLSETARGVSTELKDWLPLDSLHRKACTVLKDSVLYGILPPLERIDVRKSRGVVKFIFEDYYGVQLDGATGKLLNFERRRSDLIENIHDGSILDYFFKTSGGEFKLVYTTLTGLALLTFTVSGFWLWYGPKRMRKTNRHLPG